MSKAIFIYCNQCYETNTEVQLKFFVTNCFHIFCARCLANVKNYCCVCKKQCKALRIDENLPKDVKLYFDKNYTNQLMQTALKIYKFQSTQAKNYVSKEYRYGSKYSECRSKLLQLHQYKKEISESCKREQQIIRQLKDAYRTKVIRPELFQLRSPSDSASQLMQTPSSISIEGQSKFSYLSSDKGIDVTMKSPSISDSSSKYLRPSNLNRESQKMSQHASQRSMINIAKDARKDLIAKVIRDMSQAGQSQRMHSQNKKQYF